MIGTTGSLRVIAVVVLLVVSAALSSCSDSASSNQDASPDADSDTDSDADAATDAGTDAGTDTDTDSDSDSDTETDTETVLPTDCTGLDDFTPCLVITDPDRSYDICVCDACVSPGCGDSTCNAPSPHFPLSDTSQHTCYNETGTMVCPAAEEDFFGQDAQYGWDAWHEPTDRFTCDASIVPDNPVVTDNVTGLMWQGCALGYSGGSCETTIGSTTFAWADALAECDSLSWSGYEDWRLPDEFELTSIVDFGTWAAPFVDIAAFPATPSGEFWSSSSRATGSTLARGVSFSSGDGISEEEKISALAVRCVRSGPMEGRNFEVSTTSEEPVVEDSLTELTWQGCPAGLSGETCAIGTVVDRDWQDALSYCETLSWNGLDDWRLPNAIELLSISSNHAWNPSIDLSAFPETPGTWFWSSTSYAAWDDGAWVVDFYRAISLDVDKSIPYVVRCVRGGMWD